MVSVIIPTFNRLELLKITLQSFFRQSYSDIELIVVDDHSTDGTWAYLQQLNNEQVISVRAKGKGPGAARNTGLSIATGEYIKFFDSDDVLTVNSLEAQLRSLQQSSEALVYSPYVHARWEHGVWQQADVVLQYHPIPKHCSWHSCMRKGFFTIIPSMLFRSELLRDVGQWRTDLTAYEDWDFLWRIGNHTRLGAFTNQCATIYRFHGEQTTDQNLNNQRRDIDKLKCISNLLQQNSLSLADTVWLQMQYYRTEKLHQKVPQNLLLQTLEFYNRLRNKTQRLLTKTNWERMHGPCTDAEIFRQYIEML